MRLSWLPELAAAVTIACSSSDVAQPEACDLEASIELVPTSEGPSFQFSNAKICADRCFVIDRYCHVLQGGGPHVACNVDGTLDLRFLVNGPVTTVRLFVYDSSGAEVFQKFVPPSYKKATPTSCKVMLASFTFNWSGSVIGSGGAGDGG